MHKKIMLNWQANNYFGWGLLGLNIFQRWAIDPDVQPLMGRPIGPADVQAMDPLRMFAMGPAVIKSNTFLAGLIADKTGTAAKDIIVVNGFGNRFGAAAAPHFKGRRTIARCVLEDTRVDNARQLLASHDDVLCASNWSADILRATSGKPVTMIYEGIDSSQFFPGPKSGVLDPSKFYVFSGGKIEFRKGHDLVLLAFREFAARHKEAVLVAAWHSPWPKGSVGFQGKLKAPLRMDARGVLDVKRWVIENGVDESQFLELPPTPNPLIPSILREMDCAVQVSRCEAATNLPAKEAMACGIPVILANNTGARDLVGNDNCVALSAQAPVTSSSVGTEGWGESSVEEIVAALEMLFTDSESRKQIGARGAQWIMDEGRTWGHHAAALKSYLLT